MTITQSTKIERKVHHDERKVSVIWVSFLR